MSQMEILLKNGYKLIELCGTKKEAMKILDSMQTGTVAPHNSKWAVLS